MPDAAARRLATIEKALHIRKQIEALQASLNSLYSGEKEQLPAKPTDGRKGKRSAATIAKMAAAQKARWRKKHRLSTETIASDPVAKGEKKKRTMSPEAREKIAAAQRARWAKRNTA